MFNQISVVVPAHNEERFIRRCLESIVAAGAHLPAPPEIVVVLNRCTDATEEIARSFGARCLVNDERCLAAIRNTGVRAARGNFVVTIDADSWMSEGALAEIDARLARGDVVGGGSWIRPERVSLGILCSVLVVLPYLLWSLVRHRVCAGMFWFTRAQFDAIGGFDESLVSLEDLDFAVRLKRHGALQGLPFRMLRHAHITTSCRKFDEFGDWYLVWNPGLVRALASGKSRSASDRYYYDVRS